MREAGTFLIFASVFAVLSGCGGAGGDGYEVTGTVTFKGSPLDYGTIRFVPQDKENRDGGAVIENGKYVVKRDKGGLKAGKYQVMISSAASKPKEVEGPPGEAGPEAKERIPDKYNINSREVIEVKAGGPNVFDFNIP